MKWIKIIKSDRIPQEEFLVTDGKQIDIKINSYPTRKFVRDLFKPEDAIYYMLFDEIPLPQIESEIEMIAGTFHFLEKPGGSMDFYYKDMKYTFVDNEKYVIPVFVKNALNNCNYTKYIGPLESEKVHRYYFKEDKDYKMTPCKWNAQLKEDPGCDSKSMFVMKCIGECGTKRQ